MFNCLAVDNLELVTNDSDKEIEHDDQVEEAADEEYQPVDFTEQSNVVDIESAQGIEERGLPESDIAFEVQIVCVRIF